MQTYFQYWGKAQRQDEQAGEAFHLLPYHCLDVAAVASVWWDNSSVIRNSFLKNAVDVTPKQLKAWVLFFIALHDYGKFDIRFQRKCLAVWEQLQTQHFDVLPCSAECKAYKHGNEGLFWYFSDQGEIDSNSDIGFDIIDLLDDGSEAYTYPWIASVAGHHGFVFQDERKPDAGLPYRFENSVAQQLDKQARLAWQETVAELFLHPVGLSLADDPPPPSSLLAGFCSIADWLGSRSEGEHFPYTAKPCSVAGLQAYFVQKCQQDAQHVLQISGVLGAVNIYQGVQALLENDYTPRQLQTVVEQIAVENDLTIIEAPTGSGKTEAALAYAWRLLEAGRAESIVFALPTQATANAMLARLERLAPRLFTDHPNLLLAHGRAKFNEQFIALKTAGNTVQAQDEAWAQCNAWLGQSRKRVFLGQIGVCTVDQVLVSVLPVKHRFIRSFGVGRSVLIVDEVHAYDTYMYGLLEAVLKQQYEVGAPTVLLSATLPFTQRQQLANTVGSKLESQQAAYPLVTSIKGQDVRLLPLPDNEQPLSKEVTYECLTTTLALPTDSLLERMILAAEQGAQVVCICNVVDQAQAVVRLLQALNESIPITLFHARFSFHDRQVKEQQVLSQFGKDGKRTSGSILVATQVVEQSLDVDFDWMITQLCPVDLLFQRMGRLHRHDRQRPQGFEQALCTILLPENDVFEVHGLIYGNTRVLWRTAEQLRSQDKYSICFPEAYRDWIEQVYAIDSAQWRGATEPEWVTTSYQVFEDEQANKRCSANQMLRWAKDVSLEDDEAKVQAVTRDGEFGINVIPYKEVAGKKQLLGSV